MLDRPPKVLWAWIGPVLSFLAGAFIFVAWGALASATGSVGHTPPPWYALALFEVCWLVLGGLAIWGLLHQALTIVTTSGISQLTFRGRVTLVWKEVSEVRRIREGRGIELRGDGKVIRVSSLFYPNGDQALDWIFRQLPESVRGQE